MTTLTEPAEQPSPDPTEAIQQKDENERRAVDAERRDINETPSQPLSEASQVTTLTELTGQPSAPDPSQVIQLEDENGERATDAERRGVGGTPNQLQVITLTGKTSQAITLTGSAEQPSAPNPIEVIQLKDDNEERAADAERRGVGGTLSQSLSEASEATTVINSPEEPNKGSPAEVLHSNNAERKRVFEILKALERAAHAKRRSIGGMSGQPLSRPSEVSSPTASLQEPSTPDPTEALHSKDANKDTLVEVLKAFKRAADAKRRGIGGTPSQPLSTPTKGRTPTQSPEDRSAADLAEAFRSNDTDKDRVVKVLKALMKRSQGR